MFRARLTLAWWPGLSRFHTPCALRRQLAAGDRLRVMYDGLSKDPASLSNLDQDLPNYAQVGGVGCLRADRSGWVPGRGPGTCPTARRWGAAACCACLRARHRRLLRPAGGPSLALRSTCPAQVQGSRSGTSAGSALLTPCLPPCSPSRPLRPQSTVPIFSLPQEWLWCETWCGNETRPQVGALARAGRPCSLAGLRALASGAEPIDRCNTRSPA